VTPEVAQFLLFDAANGFGFPLPSVRGFLFLKVFLDAAPFVPDVSDEKSVLRQNSPKQ